MVLYRVLARVFCVKMLEKISIPSGGHPVFPIVSHSVEELGRSPTRLIGVPPGAPVTVQAAGAITRGQGMFGPPGVGSGADGKGNTFPAGRSDEKAVSAKNRPEVAPSRMEFRSFED